MMGMLADFKVSYARFQLCILFLDCDLGALYDFAVQKKNIYAPVKRHLREMG